MHTEHLANVHLGWVAAGWLVAAAVTSLVFLVLVSLGLLGADSTTESLWAVVAVALGFWAGGFFIGTRSIDAPILHGIAIGLASLVVWFLLNLLVNLALRPPDWSALTPTLTAALLLEQMVVAVAGAWVGHRIAMRGETGLSE